MHFVIEALEALTHRALGRARDRLTTRGKVDGRRVDRDQLGAHGLAYLATELEACRQIANWASDSPYEHEKTIAHAYVGEVARALRGGIELGPSETVGPAEMWITSDDLAETIGAEHVVKWAEEMSHGDRYVEIAKYARDVGFGRTGVTDPTLAEIRSESASGRTPCTRRSERLSMSRHRASAQPHACAIAPSASTTHAYSSPTRRSEPAQTR